jgi:RNA polymerase sigma factor (sigma-70 family)
LEPPTQTADLDAVSDANLVRLGIDGNERALRALFGRYQREVMLYCVVSARGDRDRALDLAQEIWGRTFEALRRINPDAFRGFLATVTRNVCRTRGGQELRRRAMELLVDLEVFEAEATNDEVEAKAAREERIEVVQRLIANVSDLRVRAIVSLKYLEPEHTVDEIAQKLAMPRGTVCVKLKRFHAAIRSELLAALLSDESWRA